MGIVSVRDAEKVLAMESGDPYTAMWISFMSLNYILKMGNSVMCISPQFLNGIQSTCICRPQFPPKSPFNDGGKKFFLLLKNPLGRELFDGYSFSFAR